MMPPLSYDMMSHPSGATSTRAWQRGVLTMSAALDPNPSSSSA